MMAYPCSGKSCTTYKNIRLKLLKFDAVVRYVIACGCKVDDVLAVAYAVWWQCRNMLLKRVVLLE
jgi:hypothetical protein